MPPEYLTKDTFEAWATGFDLRLKDIAAVRATVDEHGRELAVLKDRSDQEDARARRVSAIVAAAVSGAISAVIGFFFRGSHA